MGYAISAFLLIMNAFLSRLRKNGNLMAVLLLLFMWTLFWSNYSNPDYNNYLRTYNNFQMGAKVFDGSSAEFGYRILMKLFTTLGFEFAFFRAFVAGICYFLIHNTIKKYTIKYNYLYMLYFIFPFFLDVVQIRNFVAMSLLVYATQFLLENTKKDKMKFVGILLIAASFHYSALLYLPFVLINLKKKNKKIYIVVISSIFISLVILLNDKKVPFLTEIIKYFIDSDKVLGWFDESTDFGFLLFWFTQTLSFLMALFSKKLMALEKKKLQNYKGEVMFEKKNERFERQSNFIELTYWINLLAFLYFPFYLLASTFTRLFRNLILINYITFAIVNENINKSNDKHLFNYCVFLYVFFLFAVYLFRPYLSSIIDAVLNNNIFS